MEGSEKKKEKSNQLFVRFATTSRKISFFWSFVMLSLLGLYCQSFKPIKKIDGKKYSLCFCCLFPDCTFLNFQRSIYLPGSVCPPR